MLRRLAHPAVAELHDVYHSKSTVDMVLSIYDGGDLASGMFFHWDTKGDIPIATVRNLVWQMLRAIEWLHRNSVAHRDVKPENYLLDRVDLGHAQCRVFLSDFGTAVELQPDERLTQHCGTDLYWSPEFCAHNYGLKVDVWALGVSMYGLVSGEFPFADEAEVQTKSIRAPLRCDELGRNFLQGILSRSEDGRSSAREALQHPFLASLESTVQLGDASSNPGALAEQVGDDGDNPVESSPPSLVACALTVTTAPSSDASERLQDGSILNETVDLPRRAPWHMLRPDGLSVIICLFMVISFLFIALHVDSLSLMFASRGLCTNAVMQVLLVPTVCPSLRMQGCWA